MRNRSIIRTFGEFLLRHISIIVIPSSNKHLFNFRISPFSGLFMVLFFFLVSGTIFGVVFLRVFEFVPDSLNWIEFVAGFVSGITSSFIGSCLFSFLQKRVSMESAQGFFERTRGEKKNKSDQNTEENS